MPTPRSRRTSHCRSVIARSGAGRSRTSNLRCSGWRRSCQRRCSSAPSVIRVHGGIRRGDAQRHRGGQVLNEQRADDLSIHEAMARVAALRMRPVLMIASVATLRLGPMRLSNVGDAETHRPLATMVVGSLFISSRNAPGSGLHKP
ncbi:MAG: efflux RND transporter permease subunit [Dokdonella sp.]